MSDHACRMDVWLWRARLFKTRSLAAAVVESGRVRRTRGGVQSRAEKPSATVRVGDELIFAARGRLVCLRVEALGTRRGSPAQARNLYATVSAAPSPQATAPD